MRLEAEAHAAGFRVVAGVDEAGRGPWAGPVVAAVVVLDPATLPAGLALRLDDSKRLAPRVREELFAGLATFARVGVGRAEAAEIDAVNVLEATMLAMARALAALGAAPDLALVDGNRPPALPCAVRCVVGGDGRSLSVAAASIVAKVTRDRLMVELARDWPGYGFERNKGYGTAEHRRALERLGVTPEHRRSFRPILNMLSRSAAGLPYVDSRSGP
jgi:ribonuclease HII